MKGQNSQTDVDSGSKRFLSLVFWGISILGFFSLAFISGNYLDALSIPLIIGFIWLGIVKQKLAWAVALVAFYVVLVVLAINANYMNSHFLLPIMMTVFLIVLGNAMIKLSLRKSAIMVVSVILGLALLYFADILDKNTVIILAVGLGAGLLGSYLFPELRQQAAQQ